MTIITWNCNMAFRMKAAHILAYNPDILVIPESEHPDKLLFPADIKQPTDILWFGDNKNKGLAILSYSKFRFTVHELHNQDLQMVVPITVSDGKFEFMLFAIWANNPNDKDGPYVEQVWKALQCYSQLLTNKKIILAGDFNSNTIWDRPKRIGNHTHVVELLKTNKISSAYHAHFKQEQGRELHPTHYLYRHADKPYHLDYCFASSYFMKRINSVEIGDHGQWCKLSDHVPIIVNFNIPKSKKNL